MEERFQKLREDIRAYTAKEEQEREDYRQKREKAKGEKSTFIGGLVELFNNEDVQNLLKRTYESIPLIYDTSYGPYGRDYQVSISGKGLHVSHERGKKTYEFPAKSDEWFEAIEWGNYDDMGDEFGPYRDNDEPRERNRRGSVCRFTLEDLEKRIRDLMK